LKKVMRKFAIREARATIVLATQAYTFDSLSVGGRVRVPWIPRAWTGISY
jgi:hypothetical protein